MTGGHPVASASHRGLELLDLGIVRINEVRAADSGQQDRPEGTGPVASGGDHRLQLAGAVAAGRDQDPSAPEGASADLKEEERAVWLVVLNLVNEALDDGQALAQSDRLGVIDGLSRGTSEVPGDCLRQHDVECGGARIERVLFHRCLGTSRWKRQVSERTKELGPPVRIWGPSWCWKLKSVREKGLEPSRPKAPGPKPGASTNSATRAVRRPLYRPKSRIAECGGRCRARISPLSPRPVRRAAA